PVHRAHGEWRDAVRRAAPGRGARSLRLDGAAAAAARSGAGGLPLGRALAPPGRVRSERWIEIDLRSARDLHTLGSERLRAARLWRTRARLAVVAGQWNHRAEHQPLAVGRDRSRRAADLGGQST